MDRGHGLSQAAPKDIRRQYVPKELPPGGGTALSLRLVAGGHVDFAGAACRGRGAGRHHDDHLRCGARPSNFFPFGCRGSGGDGGGGGIG